MAADAYELSAPYINGLVQAARTGGVLESVLATAAPDFRAALQRPALRPWWDARFAEDLAGAIRESFGDAAVEQVGYDVVAQTMGPLAQPLVDQALAAGRGPEALFERMGDFAAMAVRPVRTAWTPLSATAGRFELYYPRALRPETGLLWRGVLRYAFDIARRLGRITRQTDGPEAGHLVYEVEWA